MTSYSVDDLRNYSVEENFKKLEELIENNPDLWSDRYMMGTGQQLLRLISAGQSITGVKTLMALREAFSGTMGRKDSLLGYAETMGYSVFRGSNEILKLTVVPSQDQVVLKRDVIGKALGAYDLIAMNDYAFQEGVSQDIEVKVGNRIITERTIPDSTYRYIRFLNKNISDDYIIYKNNVLFPSSQEFKDLHDGKCAVITNAYEGVDIWFLSTEENPVETGDIWKVDYIEYVDLNYTLEDLTFDYGTISSGTQISGVRKPEGKEDIRVNAPTYRDVQRDILANKDILKVFRTLLNNEASVNVTNLNTVHSLLTYYYKDKHLLKDSEIADLEEQIKPTYYFGYCPSTIEHPVIDFATLGINISLQDMSYRDQIFTKIDDIVKSYEALNTPIDLKQIVYQINGITDDSGYRYIKFTDIDVTEMPSGATYYKIGDCFKDSGSLLRVRGFKYESGSSLTALSNGYYYTGEVLLQPYRAIWGVDTLEDDTYYNNGDIIKTDDTHYYRVCPYLTLPTEPTFESEIGAITYSGNLIWLTIPSSIGDPAYTEGDWVIKGKVVKPSSGSNSVQLIGFRMLIADAIDDNLITEDITNSTFLTSKWNYYNSINYTLNIGT